MCKVDIVGRVDIKRLVFGVLCVIRVLVRLDNIIGIRWWIYGVGFGGGILEMGNVYVVRKISNVFVIFKDFGGYVIVFVLVYFVVDGVGGDIVSILVVMLKIV